MSKINNDILFLILNELNDDNESLFSYLLVNKDWCETTVPILWSDPWKYIKYDSNNVAILLHIILSHLPESSRKILTNEGIDIIPEEQQKLLFDYINFCKYIISFDQYDDFWSYKYSMKRPYPLNKHQLTLLKQEIYKLFVSKCSAVKTLDSYLIKYPIHELPGANACLLKLYELKCKTPQTSFLYGLAQICRLLEKINIDLYDDDPGLAKLIEMQKQIKYIKIQDRSFSGTCFKSIAQALEKQAHSILNLELQVTERFPFILFPKFNNLQTLLLSCYKTYKSQEVLKYLTVVVYPKLEILELFQISLELVTKIIQNTKGNLWKVLIASDSINFDHSREYFQAIYKYCPNVKYVSIFVNDQNLDELEKLLTICHYLIGVDVQVGDYCDDKFLDLLVKLAPFSLHEIQIDLGIFTIESLDLFFNNWRGRRALCLYYIYHWYNIYELIEKYKVEGVIKKYITRFQGFWEVDKRSKKTWNN